MKCTFIFTVCILSKQQYSFVAETHGTKTRFFLLTYSKQRERHTVNRCRFCVCVTIALCTILHHRLDKGNVTYRPTVCRHCWVAGKSETFQFRANKTGRKQSQLSHLPFGFFACKRTTTGGTTQLCYTRVSQNKQHKKHNA